MDYGRLLDGPTGQLCVLDKLALSIRVFGSDGQFVREFGGPGKGPGEFSDPAALAWSADGHLWVPERFEMRYSVFDSVGRFVKTVSRPLFQGVNRRVYPATFDTGGALLDHASFGAGAGIFRVDTTGKVLDTFHGLSAEFPGRRVHRGAKSGMGESGAAPEAEAHLDPRSRWDALDGDE